MKSKTTFQKMEDNTYFIRNIHLEINAHSFTSLYIFAGKHKYVYKHKYMSRYHIVYIQQYRFLTIAILKLFSAIINIERWKR